MSIPENFEELPGKWNGNNRLHVPWMEDEPIRDSNSDADVSFAANGKYLKIEYDWRFNDEKQQGLMILTVDKESKVEFIWVDSWHQSNGFMICTGVAADNKISVKGFYKVPENPDWGWRTDIIISGTDSFSFTMFNVSPDGKEDLAVEANFNRG